MRIVRQQDLVDAPWYLVLCRPNQNHIAARQLAQRGFEVFMPLHRTTRRWRGRLIEGLTPVFAGYLFLGTDKAEPRWHEISKAPGVARLIGFGPHGPAPIPSAIVTGLMMRCDTDGCIVPDTEYQIGEQVRITCGPFADFVSTIDSISADRRIHVLIEIMGRAARVAIEAASITRQG